jgi:hypothetical protein
LASKMRGCDFTPITSAGSQVRDDPVVGGLLDERATDVAERQRDRGVRGGGGVSGRDGGDGALATCLMSGWESHRQVDYTSQTT